MTTCYVNPGSTVATRALRAARFWRNGDGGEAARAVPDNAFELTALDERLSRRRATRERLVRQGWSSGTRTWFCGHAGRHGPQLPAKPPECLITADLGPIVYSIHHPFVASASAANSTTWWDEFGYLVAHTSAAGQAPVVVGEWTNIDAGRPPHLSVAYNPYCWPSAPSSVRMFLAYLQKIKVGMNAYPVPPLLGAGADVLSWFRSRN